MLHPFMGIEEWDRAGISVEESSQRLQRIGYVDRQLMRMEAGHMTARPEYEIKGALARMLWQDAEFYNQLRNRCKQLRMGFVAFEKCPDPDLESLMTQALQSENTLALLVALFKVVKPAQIAAIQAYLRLAQPIVDEPTIGLLRHQLLDREEQISWGLQALKVVTEAASEEERLQARKWESYLQALLRAAGGIHGEDPKQAVAMEVVMDSKPFELPRQSTRDQRFQTTMVKLQGMRFEDSDQGRFLQMMLHRYFEMSPAEAIAYVHFASEGKPWAFYHDTARHIWDEARHAWFGEAALRSKGYDVYSFRNWTGWYDMTAQLFVQDEAYTHLTIAIEKAAMKYPPGKREEWEFCRDSVRDPLMTTFQDFDWADEVVHAGFGQRWIIEAVHGGDSRKAAEAAEATVTKRAAFMKQHESGDSPPDHRFAGGY
ncbi:hypothetical protein ACP26L_18200 [Paenibacillus sp. S-38]|uniref:hypothetical protein n=1 Tax=Paenibacillus sp. S-38 TaxID=3416710 RepID=UPI003CF10BC6